MRDRKAGRASSNRRRRGAKAVDLEAFSARASKRAGQLVGRRYRLEGLLGNGATANVYLATDTQTGDCVVVKQLTPDGTQNLELQRRFLMEAEALATIGHSGIVRVLDFGAPTDERPFLVMEALVGETLASLLKRRPLLPIGLALNVARQTALALEAAHAAGLVHRDVKPNNLFLIGPKDEPFGVKLIDFGMAKLPQSNGTSGVHTVLGTVEYMAPEQVMADPVDCRTDIYGFGILLFRLFTGHLPFEAPEGLDLLSHQLFTPVPPASWVNSRIEPNVDALVARATRKHPDNRYPDVRALLDDLDAVIGSSPDRTIASAPLVVDPDVYEPRNEKAREVAALMAARYELILPNQSGMTAHDAAMSLMRFRTLPPDAAAPPDFAPLDDEDLELIES